MWWCNLCFVQLQPIIETAQPRIKIIVAIWSSLVVIPSIFDHFELLCYLNFTLVEHVFQARNHKTYMYMQSCQTQAFCDTVCDYSPELCNLLEITSCLILKLDKARCMLLVMCSSTPLIARSVNFILANTLLHYVVFQNFNRIDVFF